MKDFISKHTPFQVHPYQQDFYDAVMKQQENRTDFIVIERPARSWPQDLFLTEAQRERFKADIIIFDDFLFESDISQKQQTN